MSAYTRKPHCANCNNLLENEQQVSKILIQDEFSREVLVCDAIAYIYGISSEEFQNISTHYSKNNSNINLPSAELGSEVFLCSSCALLLFENYITHTLFQKSTGSSSFVEHLKTFRGREASLVIEEKREKEEESHLVSEDFEGGFSEESVSEDQEREDLFEDFNYESSGDTTSEEEECEEKYEPEEEDSVSTLTAMNKNESSRLPKTPVEMKEVVIHLEKLPNDHLKDKCGIINRGNSTKSRNNMAASIRRKYSLRGPQFKRKCLKPKTTKNYKKSIKCEICEHVFINRFSWNSHRILQHGTEEEKSVFKCACEVCGKLVFRKELKAHFRDKHSQEAGAHKCAFCDKTFSTSGYKQKHEKLHRFSKDFSCSVCGKIFHSRKYLQEHIVTIHGSEEQKRQCKIACSVCGKLLRPNNMKKHLEVKHSDAEKNQRIHKCDYCQKEYSSKIHFEEHLLTHSEDFRHFLCGICGKTFDSKALVSAHELIHEERKFPCPVCSRKFINKATLRIHQQSHSTERPFSCEECHQTFKFRSHYSSHMKIHREMAENKGGTFQCQICQKFFKHSRSLSQHKAKEHKKEGKKIFECSFCGKRLYNGKNLRLHEDLHRRDPHYQPRKCMVKGTERLQLHSV